MAESTPKISVIIVTYNHEHYIGDCIDSILAQTLDPFEIIICDDHSTDKTWQIVKKYLNNYPDRIKAFRQKKNVGGVENSQLGRRVYSGDYVSVIEGDDIWFPSKLEAEWTALQKNPVARIAYSGVLLIDENGKHINSWTRDDNRYPEHDVFIEVYSKKFFSKTRSLFRNQLMYREVLDKEGYCDETLDSYWDWDMKIRMTYRYKVAYSGQHVVAYRIHSTGFSQSDPAKHLKAFIQIYEKHLPLLDNKTLMESFFVKYHMETVISERYINLYGPDHSSYYSPLSVYRRNQSLFNKIYKIKLVKKKFTRLLSNFIVESIKYDMIQGYTNEALKTWFFFFINNLTNPLSYQLLKNILLPMEKKKWN